MILQNKDQFTTYIPTATKCDWMDMETYRNSAERWLRDEILGRVLYEELTIGQHREDLAESIDLCRKIISLDAYSRAIPFLDLIQHANGFGVISNENLAPASRDRVNRLIEETKSQRDIETEVLLNYLEDTPSLHDAWKGSRAYSILSDSLIMTSGELKRLCSWDGSRTDFLKLKPVILLRMYNDIGRWVSRQYVEELVEQQRDNDLTPVNLIVLDRLKFALANYVIGNMRDADLFRDEAVTFLDNAPEDYPTYVNSREYELRHRSGIENTTDSPIYIFGGI